MTVTKNGLTIDLSHDQNGTLAVAMITDSAGTYRYSKLYQGYSDLVVIDMFTADCKHKETF